MKRTPLFKHKQNQSDALFAPNEQAAPSVQEGAAEAPSFEGASCSVLEKARQQYKTARANLLLVAICTSLNVLLSFFSDWYLLFSANIPYLVTVFGNLLATETAAPVFLYAAIALSACLVAPYFLGYFLSEKHCGWMLACLVYFVLDTVAMLLILVLFGDHGNALLDAVFHAWVLFELFLGLRCDKKCKAAKAVASATGEAADETAGQTR